ncbi:MAG: hydroxymethylglutaryl-CoA lyase [Gammaproteobacteria bacterium RIFCSPHIGHO2_12_FULL_45_9]|nr:MAG: hydroxymethylglutaryl-CoA lyase [Gammaproteobacteria bacterium RIFCSPHIGHO2_12_FULL_45_9]
MHAGVRQIEVSSFVSPKWVPQMADHQELFQQLHREPQVRYIGLVPNVHGLHSALAVNTPCIAVFTAASETFSLRNINCSIEDSFQRIEQVMIEAKAHHIPVRGYVSCVMGCPYEGDIPVKQVISVVERLLSLGCYEVSLGDTIGVGTAPRVKQLLSALIQSVPVNQLAAHFHDTYAQALVNLYVALEQGIRTIDSSVAGLGGCPYARGAGGNVATEDVVYLVEGLGFKTGINLPALSAAGQVVTDYLGITPRSRVALALRSEKM